MLKEISNHRGSCYAKYDETEKSYHVARDMDLSSGESLLEDLFDSSLDFSYPSEAYCLGNFGMASDVYDAKTGSWYRVPFAVDEEYLQGSEVVLYQTDAPEEE